MVKKLKKKATEKLKNFLTIFNLFKKKRKKRKGKIDKNLYLF